MRIRVVFVLPLVLAAGVAAGFALASSDRASSTVVVRATMNATLGKKVLVTASGLTLYRNKTEIAGRVKCTDGCASVWPPLTLPIGVTHATAGAGVTQTSLGKLRRPDGKWQVTYKGQRLYRYAADRRPGQVRGQGIGGIWFTVSPTTSSSAGTTTATASTSTSSTPYPTYP